MVLSVLFTMLYPRVCHWFSLLTKKIKKQNKKNDLKTVKNSNKTTMVNYQNGKIYRLVSGSGKQYIGSTTQKLCKRMVGHRADYRSWKKGQINFITSFSLFEEEGDVSIILIENYPCENNEELHKRERYWIEAMDCVNKVIPTRTFKEYVEDNRQHISQYQKEYREKNREIISQYKKQYAEENREHISQYKKEYRETNRERLKQKEKEYYESNKQQINQERQRKIQCECGAEITYSGLSRHKKTKKHQDAIQHCSILGY